MIEALIVREECQKLFLNLYSRGKKYSNYTKKMKYKKKD